MKAELEIRVAWWLPVYIRCLAFFCVITGMEPDWAKFNRVVLRALSIRVKR